MLKHNRIIPIVEAMLPVYPEIQSDDARLVAESIAIFIEAEIQGMDIFLRLPCLALLKVFYFLPLLIYGRPFNLLSLEKKKNCIYSWENSKLYVLKDFIKLFRYLIILSYYDHPFVQQAIGIDRKKQRQSSIYRRLELIKLKEIQ